MERRGRFYWRKPDGSWQASESSGGASTVGKHLDEFQVQLEKIDRKLDGATLARDYFAVMSHLSPLLRTARHLHSALQEARTAIASPELITCRAGHMKSNVLLNCCTKTPKMASILPPRATAEQQAEASHRMEVAAHRLNLLAAFFLSPGYALHRSLE